MRYDLSRTFKIVSVTSLILAGVSSPTIASHTPGNCPFERTSVSAVVLAQNTQTEDNVEQTQTETSQTETSQVQIDAVERVRQVYKQICSRSTRVELPPVEPRTVSEPAPVPVEQPATIEPEKPIRALW